MSSKTPEESKFAHENYRPTFELARAFIPVLITSNFDDESTKNERASMETNVSIKMKLISSAQHFPSLRDTRGRVTIIPVIEIMP